MLLQPFLHDLKLKMDAKQLDLYKKLVMVQSIEGEDCTDSNTSQTQVCVSLRLSAHFKHDLDNFSCAQRILAKKKLNIPICDVHVDRDYEKNVPASFALPPSYVKHSKKIGDEVDVSIDYVVDTSDKVCCVFRVQHTLHCYMPLTTVVCSNGWRRRGARTRSW